MTENREYISIKGKYLAEGLAWLGFTYFKYQDREGDTYYSFENTEKFNKAHKKMIELKQELNKK
jgi:hypothetical protein